MISKSCARIFNKLQFLVHIFLNVVAVIHQLTSPVRYPELIRNRFKRKADVKLEKIFMSVYLLLYIT